MEDDGSHASSTSEPPHEAGCEEPRQGRGRGRGRGKKQTHRSKAPNARSTARCQKKRKGIDSLHSSKPAAESNNDSEQTSETEETKRIRLVRSAQQASSTKQSQIGSGSETGSEPDSQTAPRGSQSLIHFTRRIYETILTSEENMRLVESAKRQSCWVSVVQAWEQQRLSVQCWNVYFSLKDLQKPLSTRASSQKVWSGNDLFVRAYTHTFKKRAFSANVLSHC